MNLVKLGVIVCIILLVAIFNNDGPEPLDSPQINNVSQTAPDPKIACIADLPIRFKLSQKLMLAAYEPNLAEQTQSFAKHRIGGVILMSEFDKASIQELAILLGNKPIIATDQEGGTVQRFKNFGTLPSAEAMAVNSNVQQAYEIYNSDSRNLASAGINANFAPVAGVISSPINPLPGRFYSSDPEVVSKFAGASVSASLKAGITPVVKHFPGLGSASLNTDFGSTTTHDLNAIMSLDLVPFKRLAGPGVDAMISSAIVPGLTDGQPALWSKAAVRFLREIGYDDSVIYTDSLSAKSIPAEAPQATVMAWQAGADIALITQAETTQAELDLYISLILDFAEAEYSAGLLQSQMVNESIARIFKRKNLSACDLAGLKLN